MSGSKDESESSGNAFIDKDQKQYLEKLWKKGFNTYGKNNRDFRRDVFKPATAAFQEFISGPQTNPFLEGQIEQGQTMINRNLNENLLPQISSGAEQAQQLGGSRQGVAEGIALRGTQEANADLQQTMRFNDYNMQRQQQMQALGLSGQMGQLPFQPLNQLSGIIGRPTVLNNSSSDSKGIAGGFGSSG